MLKVASNKHSDFPYILLVRYITEEVSCTIECLGISVHYFFNLLFNQNALTLGNSPRKYTYLGKHAARWCTTLTELKLQMISSIKEESGGSRLPSFLYYLEMKLPRNWELHLSNYLYSWQALRPLEMMDFKDRREPKYLVP